MNQVQTKALERIRRANGFRNIKYLVDNDLIGEWTGESLEQVFFIPRSTAQNWVSILVKKDHKSAIQRRRLIRKYMPLAEASEVYESAGRRSGYPEVQANTAPQINTSEQAAPPDNTPSPDEGLTWEYIKKELGLTRDNILAIARDAADDLLHINDITVQKMHQSGMWVDFVGECVICKKDAYMCYPLLPEYPAFCRQHHTPEYAGKYGVDFSDSGRSQGVLWDEAVLISMCNTRGQMNITANSLAWRDSTKQVHTLKTIDAHHLSHIINHVARSQRYIPVELRKEELLGILRYEFLGRIHSGEVQVSDN